MFLQGFNDAFDCSFRVKEWPEDTEKVRRIEDCLYKARLGMEEHIALLREQGLPVPPPAGDPKVTIQNAKPVPA